MNSIAKTLSLEQFKSDIFQHGPPASMRIAKYRVEFVSPDNGKIVFDYDAKDVTDAQWSNRLAAEKSEGAPQLSAMFPQSASSSVRPAAEEGRSE